MSKLRMYLNLDLDVVQYLRRIGERLRIERGKKKGYNVPLGEIVSKAVRESKEFRNEK